MTVDNQLYIFIPQGAEYKVILRAIGQNNLFMIPMGVKSLGTYLDNWISDQVVSPGTDILLMGLCGALSSELEVGDVVVYEECFDQNGESGECDRSLGEGLAEYLGGRLVRGLTSDRVVFLAENKRLLYEEYSCDVVDMEGLAFLRFLADRGFRVGMVRVVGDRANQELPNLNLAIEDNGSLNWVSLILQFLLRPLAAIELIRSSLVALRKLQAVALAIHKYYQVK